MYVFIYNTDNHDYFYHLYLFLENFKKNLEKNFKNFLDIPSNTDNIIFLWETSLAFNSPNTPEFNSAELVIGILK